MSKKISEMTEEQHQRKIKRSRVTDPGRVERG